MNERYILGVKVNDISYQQAITRIKELLTKDGFHYIVTPNPEICLKALRNKELSEIIKRAELSLPDGFGLKIGAAIQGQKLNNRVTGIDISYELFKLAEQFNNSVLLIGGKGKSGTAAVENIKKLYPKLRIDYLNGGMVDLNGVSEFPDFIDKINALAPDVLLVNLGAPKQEIFIDNNKGRLKVKLAIGMGGSVDYLAGIATRAPNWIRKLGLEWIYRITHRPGKDEVYNPRTFGRIFSAVIVFPAMCLWWRIRNLTVYRKNVVGMVINSNKEILIAKRQLRMGDQSLIEQWQLPQGGIQVNETANNAILREMNEELGLQHLKIIGQAMNCHKYKWPNHAILYDPYKGQKQSLFLLYYDGTEEIKLDPTELTDYRWVKKEHIIELAHPFRREIIKIGLEKFQKYL